MRGLRGDEWGKEVLREYRLLLLGQSGGDGAKEEMAQILAQRQRDGVEKPKGWRLFCAFSDGLVLGTKTFVGKWVKGFQEFGKSGPPELYRDLFSGQKKCRRSKGG
ncbi:MAG: hypothetical protein LAT55_02790 [Opitutales bacterium]|nr:hypothetical protein [Opitutales bacterium]